MKKNEFLSEVEKRLTGLSAEDITRSVDYYAEMIDDRVEDGIPEEDAVLEMGSPEEAASAILLDMPLGKVVKARIKRQRRLKGWETAMLIIGSPLWLSLGIAAVAVVFALLVSLWAIVFALYAVMLALAVSGIACAVLGAMAVFPGNYAAGAGEIGIGLVCLGLGAMLFVALWFISKGVFRLCKKIIRGIKSLFVKKEN